MATTSMKKLITAMLAASCAMSAACGDFVRQGRAPVQLVIRSLVGASGATPGTFGGTLLSDVVTLVTQTVNGQPVSSPSFFNDLGQVTMTAILKDPGQPGVDAQPSAINQVTISRYRVVYRRADGRNTPGIDVPFPFDSAVTFTVVVDGLTTAGFQLVRHTAKEEAPLAALALNPDVIATLAEVTFFGQDQAGNDVSVTGMIGVDFGNFADRN
jgi:hypothetical protein